MKEYLELIEKIAVRYSGQPITLSPQLFTDFRIQRVAGHDVDFRVVLFMGRIDPNELTITFPEDTVVKVHVKHDIKAIDEESYRRRESGQHGHRTTRAVVCSRDCGTYYRLPKGVEKGNLTAQLTEDAFLIIQSRKERSTVTGFEGKRLVPVRGYLNLDPCLSVNDLNIKVNKLMESVYRLFQRMRDIVKGIESLNLHSSFSHEPGTDVGNVSASFQDSSRSAFGLGSISQSDSARRDIGSSAQGETAEGTNRRMTRSVKSAAEETSMKETGSTTQSEPVEDKNSKETGSTIESEAAEIETGSTIESEADEIETGSTIESEATKIETGSTIELEAAERETGSTTESETVKRDMGSSAQGDTAEETNRRMTRSAKSAAEEIGKNETGSTTQSKATENDPDVTIQLEATGEDSGFSAHDEVSKETTKRTTRSAKSAAEETSKKEIGSVSLSEASVETKRTRSAQSAVTETTVEKEIDSEASAKRVTRSGQSAVTETTEEKEIDSEASSKRVTRSALQTDDTDKPAADLKSIVGKDCKETVPASESVEGGSPETAGSDSKAEESGSKHSEVPRRVRSKERPKESSAVSKLKEESKRRKSVI